MPCPSYINSSWPAVVKERVQLRLCLTHQSHLISLSLFTCKIHDICMPDNFLQASFVLNLMSLGTTPGTLVCAVLDLWWAYHAYIPCFATKPCVCGPESGGERSSTMAARIWIHDCAPGPRLLYTCMHHRELCHALPSRLSKILECITVTRCPPNGPLHSGVACLATRLLCKRGNTSLRKDPGPWTSTLPNVSSPETSVTPVTSLADSGKPRWRSQL